MRICILSEFFYPDNAGGTGMVLSDLVRSLRSIDDALEIDVVTSRNIYRQEEAKLSSFEDWNGVNIHRVGTPHPNGLPIPLRLFANLLFCLAAMAKLVRLGAYDLILVGTAPPMVAFTAQVIERLRGIPFVYVVYDLEPDRSITMKMVAPNHLIARLFQQGQRHWLHSAAKVVVLGQYMSEYLTQTYNLPAENVEVIPIGADPQEIMPGSKQSRFRAEHGLDGFVVLYSGNFGRYHNFDTILDAARALRDTRPEVRFVLVGGGAQRDHIAARIAGENLENVRLFGFVAKESYADLLASADVSLVTMEPGMEGLCVPSKLYSILASGRPVVASVSPKSEVARVIDEGHTGIHLGQGDTQRLMTALTFLADHPDEVERMGRNARRVLEEKYATEHLTWRYHAVLQDAVLMRRKKTGVFSRSARCERAVSVTEMSAIDATPEAGGSGIGG